MLDRNCRLVSLVLVLVLLRAGLGSSQTSTKLPTQEQLRFFESKIRPLLIDKCQKCHGPEKQKGAFRIDTRAGLLAGGDGGPVVDFAKPEGSPLVLAVKYDEDGPKMPPSGKLASPQVEAIVEWVKMGAPWTGDTSSSEAATAAVSAKKGMQITEKDRSHWAFQPVHPVHPPKVEGAPPAHPIDAFILAGLKAKGLNPNPPATKIELIRRATYDVTGLPPTPGEVEAFLKDKSPQSFEHLIDRLLDSPRYGEKWGRHWLDLVRFAETNSYERDNPKPNAWRYRDYVIKSFNDDKPYDRFVKEQLAGDEIAPVTTETITATGFYRLGIWDDEPVDREQARFDMLDDIVATTGQVFLGLTIDCARCHDHKIDPIPQRDYYKFVSFFNNINHFRNGGPTDEFVVPDAERILPLSEEAKQFEAKRAAALATISGLEDEFIRRYGSPGGVDVRRRDIDALKFKFYRDTWDRLPNFAGIKYEDAGELPMGYFDLSPRTRNESIGFVFEGVLVVPEAGEYTFYLDSDDGARLSVDGKAVVERDGIHALGKEQVAKVKLEAGRKPILLEYFQNEKGLGLVVGWSGPGFERRALSAPSESQKKTDVRAAIREHGMKVLGPDRMQRYQQARRIVNQKASPEMAVETVLTVSERGTTAPDTFVLGRGNAHAPGDKVEPGFLAVLGDQKANVPTPPPSAKTSGRRTILADWITSPSNPLTARVMANRVFQHHLGRGIVRSSSNFGTQGDRPTHPELLDWLASELIKGGWRLKALHRTIMLSDAYQRSSTANPAALSADPLNDTFWRFDMRRLSAEEIRDSILAIDGRLNLKMGGPGVYPEIPDEVLAGQSVPGKGWSKSPPEEAARRSVYIHVKRSLLVPILEGFDIAETDRSTPVRFNSTQPTQALGMLNGKFLNEEAVALANRIKREAGPDRAAQIRLAVKLATAREVNEAEIKRANQLIDALIARDGYSQDRALAAFCLVVLNLNEVVYLD